MTGFTLHKIETAPEDSKKGMSRVKEKYGFVPNLMGVLAAAPAALNGYLALAEQLEKSSLTPAEQQVVLLSASFANQCDYCMAAHSAGAKAAHVPETAIQELREGSPIREARLDALRTFTQAVVRQKGWVSDATLEDFIDAGFNQSQVLEVLMAVAMKTLSNYTNHLANTPLDKQLKSEAWTPPQTRSV